MHSFSFFLKLKRGAALGFTPIVAVWNVEVSRATGVCVCVRERERERERESEREGERVSE